MGSYFYLDDPENEFGYTPVPEEDMVRSILAIAKAHGVTITDSMILEKIFSKSKKDKRKKTTNLYIDGTNLFAGQNELFGPNQYLSFKYLTEEINKLVPVNNIFFYASYMNKKNRTKLTEERKRLITAEALFYREVRNTKKVIFYRGHRSPTSGKEKGVDVHLSVDLVKDIFQDNCSQVVIMTGDADLIYPLEIVKTLKIPTFAIFLPNRFSLEMAYKVDKSFVLNFSNKFRTDRKLPEQSRIEEIKKPRMINIRGK